MHIERIGAAPAAARLAVVMAVGGLVLRHASSLLFAVAAPRQRSGIIGAPRRDGNTRGLQGLAVPFGRRQRIEAQQREAESAEAGAHLARSEEHTSELQSLMRISYAVFCLKTTTSNQSSYTL